MAQGSAKLSYWSSIVIGVVIVAAAFLMLVYTGVGLSAASATAQIISRYVDQFRAGNGFVFNPGEQVLLVAAPVYILMLTLVRTVFDAQTASALLFAIATLISAFTLYRLARRAELGNVQSIFLMVVFLCVSLPWYGTFALFQEPDPTLPVAITFALVAVEIALSSRWTLAGIILAFGILCNPSAALVAAPLLLIASEKDGGQQFLLALLIPLAVAGIVLRLYYGPGWLDGLLLSASNFRVESKLWVVWLPSAVIAAYGWYKHRANPVAALCGTWIVLYLLISGALLHRILGWNDLLVIGPLLLLIFLGLEAIPFIFIAVGTGILFVVALLASNPVVDFFGSPFTIPSAKALVIGADSVPEALVSRPTSAQSIVAFDGRLQPDVKMMIERGDIQSMLVRYAPDVISIEGGGRVSADDLSSGAVVRLDYRTDGSGIFVRKSSIGQFRDYPANAVYGPDIVLSGLALDQSTLKPGQLLRVRLDWQFSRAASKPVTVDLRLRSGEYLLAHSIFSRTAATRSSRAFSASGRGARITR